MAIVNPVATIPKKFVKKVTWTGVTGDTFTPWKLNGVDPANISVQVVGGTATVAGSNQPDGSSAFPLSDLQGAAINLADGDLEAIAQRPLAIVPTLVGLTPVTLTLVIWR